MRQRTGINSITETRSLVTSKFVLCESGYKSNQMISKQIIVILLILYLSHTYASCPSDKFMRKHVKMSHENTKEKAEKSASQAVRNGYVHSNAII